MCSLVIGANKLINTNCCMCEKVFAPVITKSYQTSLIIGLSCSKHTRVLLLPALSKPLIIKMQLFLAMWSWLLVVNKQQTMWKADLISSIWLKMLLLQVAQWAIRFFHKGDIVGRILFKNYFVFIKFALVSFKFCLRIWPFSMRYIQKLTESRELQTLFCDTVYANAPK